MIDILIKTEHGTFDLIIKGSHVQLRLLETGALILNADMPTLDDGSLDWDFLAYALHQLHVPFLAVVIQSVKGGDADQTN